MPDIVKDYTVGKISPIYIDLVKENKDNSVTQIWEEQFRINNINNIIMFSCDFKKGEYKLSIGFYFMDEVHQNILHVIQEL